MVYLERSFNGTLFPTNLSPGLRGLYRERSEETFEPKRQDMEATSSLKYIQATTLNAKWANFLADVLSRFTGISGRSWKALRDIGHRQQCTLQIPTRSFGLRTVQERSLPRVVRGLRRRDLVVCGLLRCAAPPRPRACGSHGLADCVLYP